MTTFCLGNNTWKIILCQSAALSISVIDYDQKVSFFKLHPLRWYQPRGFVPSLGPFFGVSIDMSAAAPWDLGFAVGGNLGSCQCHFTISLVPLCLFGDATARHKNWFTLSGECYFSVDVGLVLQILVLAIAAAHGGVKVDTRHQGREQRKHFKLASLTKPEFLEIMASVDLMLYKLKGKLKPIKPEY